MSNTKNLSEKALENKETIVISTEGDYKKLLMELGGENIKLGNGGFMNVFLAHSQGKSGYRKTKIFHMFDRKFEYVREIYGESELKEIINFIEKDNYDISDFILWDIAAKDVLYFVNEKTNQEFVMTHCSGVWKFAYEKEDGALHYADTIGEAVKKMEYN